MAETIWNSAVSVYHFMMDNLVVINILLLWSLCFFREDLRRRYGPGCYCCILYRFSDLSCIC